MKDVPDRVEQLLEKDLREYLPQCEDAVSRGYKLQERDRTIRMTLIREAHSQAPREVTQWYDPEQHAIVMLLPDPNGDE